MTRYADPTRCPDCRTVLALSPAQCPTCALPLRGPTAVALLEVLTRADELLTALRASAAPTPTPVRVPTATPVESDRSGRRGSSVPRVLLGLGAICLLVAAVTFLAVTWSWLGVEGRTAVLLASTCSAAAAAVVLARRRLPVGAEALGTVTLGLVVLDVLGARGSGWLGGLGDGGTTAVVGVAVVLAASGLVAATRGTSGPPAAAQLGVAIGLLLIGGGVVAGTGHLTGPAAASVLAAGGLAVLARRLDLAVTADAAAVVAVTWWLGLCVTGLVDAAAQPSLRGLVVDGAGAGLLAAGLLALLPLSPLASPAVRHSRLLGPAAATVSGLLLTVLGMMPLADETAGRLLLGCLVGLAAWTVVAAAAPSRRWAAATVAPQLALALPAGVVALDLVGAAVANVVGVAQRSGPAGAPVDALLAPAPTAASPALLVPAACVLALAAAAHLPRELRRAGLAASLGTAIPAAVTALATQPVALGLVVLAAALPGLVAVTAALAVPALARGAGAGTGDGVEWLRGRRHPADPRLLPAAVMLGALALLAALPSAALTTLVLAPVTAISGLVALAIPTRQPRAARTTATALLPLASAGLVWSAADLAGLAVADRALPVLLVVGALAVACPRPLLELAALVAALPATTVALIAAAASPATSLAGSTSVTLALHLTLAGALVTTSAVLHAGRRSLAWPGGALLAAATWVRLADLGVTTPEAYTMPTALGLVAAGLARLHHDPTVTTRATVLPGLVLATLPSLLTVLAGDPVSLRALGLGLACLGLLLGGARLRWSAPVGVGGATGAVLVLAELAPYAAVVPQWLLLGAAGALLTAVGVTWEHRAADARRAARYLVRLR